MREQKSCRLIAFDVDGVIIRGFWLSQIIARLGLIKSFAFGLLGILYEARIMEIVSFMRYAYRLLRGVPKDWLIRMTDRTTLMPGVRETIGILRDQGHIIVLISSGIPDFAVHKLAKNIDANFGIGIRVELADGHLTGHIAALDCRGKSKSEAIQKLIEGHQLFHCEVVAVANDRNNVPLFKSASLSVGFRPDSVVRKHTRRVVTTPDLRAVLPIVSSPTVSVHVPRRLSQEVIRQLLHASAAIIPLLWLSHPSWHIPILLMVASISALFIISEVLRSFGIQIPLISKLVQAAGREEEINKFVLSPLYFAAGVAFPLVIFSVLLPFPRIAAASVMTFLIGDSFATIGGLFYGRHRYPFNRKKSLEGTLTGFSLVFLFLLLIVTPLSALLCTIVAAIIEMAPLPLDDNLTVPLLTATILTALQLLWLFNFI